MCMQLYLQLNFKNNTMYYMYINSFVVQNRFTLDVSLYIW